MDVRAEKCEELTAVMSFCDCMRGEEDVDGSVESFCRSAEEDRGSVTAEELTDLKIKLQELLNPYAHDACCDCE